MDDNRVTALLMSYGIGWPTPADIDGVLSSNGLSHLKGMREPGEYRHRKSIVSESEIRTLLTTLESIVASLNSGAETMLTNFIVDWAALFIYNLDGLENVRVISVEEYQLLERRLAKIEELAEDLDINTADITRFMASSAGRDYDAILTRKIEHARELTSLEVKEVLASMSMGVTEPILNRDDDVYAVVISKFTGDHFSFMVVDAETLENVNRPRLIYFDSINSKISTRNDSLILALSNVANIHAPPLATALGTDQKETDSWSCGFRTLRRMVDVSRWLSGARKYVPVKKMLQNGVPLEHSDGVFLGSMTTQDCKTLALDMLKKSAIAFAYLKMQ